MYTPIKVKSNSRLVYNNYAMTLCKRSQGIGLSLIIIMLNMAGKERENYLDTITDQTTVLKLSFISCDDFGQTKGSHY